MLSIKEIKFLIGIFYWTGSENRKIFFHLSIQADTQTKLEIVANFSVKKFWKNLQTTKFWSILKKSDRFC